MIEFIQVVQDKGERLFISLDKILGLAIEPNPDMETTYDVLVTITLIDGSCERKAIQKYSNAYKSLKRFLDERTPISLGFTVWDE